LIAVDTSSMIAWLQGDAGADVMRLEEALISQKLALPAPAAAELLSWPKASPALRSTLARLNALPVTEGFWERAGESRRILLQKGFKAKFADTLIAQCCIDANVPLIERDDDFRHFAAHCGLKLAAPKP
jgi:predicted nucleic acid-binding protein